MRRLRLLALLPILVATPAFAGDVPAPVRTAAVLHAKDVTGVMGCLVEAEMAMDGGVMGKRNTSWRAWVVTRDGEPATTLLLSMTMEGKPAPEAERQKMQARMSDPKHRNRDARDLPFEPKYMADYAYTVAPCTGCEKGATAFAFKATSRDKRHGDGTVVVGKAGRVQRMKFTPAELHERVSEANIELEYGPVGKDWWALTGMHSRFAGGFGPMKGSMIMSQKQSGYKRFRDLDDARAAAPK